MENSSKQLSINQEMQTYLQIVKYDQTQIPILLKNIHSDIWKKFQASETQEQNSLKSMLKQYFQYCSIFLFGDISYSNIVKNMQNQDSKGVCAKPLHSGDVAWKCETCEKDPTCIICQECFEKSDHKGHKVWLKRNVGGCCDCGDPTAWAEDGFCSTHKGYSTETLLENLPEYIKSSAPLVFNALGKNLKFSCLEMQRAKELKLALQYKDAYEVVGEILQNIEELIGYNQAFIHYWTEALNQCYIVESEKPYEGHECCERTFLTGGEEDKFNEEMKEIQDSKMVIEMEQKMLNICTCNVMDLTNQVNNLFAAVLQKKVMKLWLMMFQSLKFKTILGLSYIANLQEIIDSNDMSKGIVQIGVQILTIDEIALLILQNSSLRDNIIGIFDDLCHNLSEDKSNNKYAEQLMYLFHDIKYMIRPVTVKYIMTQTNFLQKMIDPMIKLYFLDKKKLITAHIGFDYQVADSTIKSVETQYIEIMNTIFKEWDYMNVEKNQEMMETFMNAFNIIEQQMLNHKDQGFFSIPIHRVFSYFFTNLIMKNFLMLKKNDSNKSNRSIFQEVMRTVVKIPNNCKSQEYLQKMITTILKPLIRSWGFVQEIISQKWIYYGYSLQTLASLYYQIFDTYLCLDLGLLQMLTCVSPFPEQTIQQILISVSFDGWLDAWFSQLYKNTFDIKEFDQLKPKFDEKKLRMMFGSILKLFINMCTTEVAFIYPLNPKKTLSFYQYNDVIQKKIMEMVEEDCKKQIVHVMLALGGRSDIEKIKKMIEKPYLKIDTFEEILMEVAVKVKDVKGKVMFKLKEKEYLGWYDPYYFIQPDKQGQLQESIQQFYSEKQDLNTLIGDYEGHYKYISPVNQVIKESLASSNIIFYLQSVTSIWQSKDLSLYQKTVIDEQIGHSSLKLLTLILQGAQSLHFDVKSQIASVFIQRNQQLLNNIMELKNGEKQLQNISEYIIQQLYKLDPQSFPEFGISEESKQEELKSLDSDSRSSSFINDSEVKKQLMKEQAVKKKQALLDKFQMNRQKFMSKNMKEIPLLMKSNSLSSATEEDESIECSLCRETLSKETYQQQPYGQCGYVTSSKLMYHTVKQTLEKQQKWLDSLSFKRNQMEEEEKKEELKEELKISEETMFDLKYLNEMKTGGVLLKCTHYAHYKCLNEYLVSQASNIRKIDMRKLIGFEIDQFQCPLCKQFSNTLIPGEVGIINEGQNQDQVLEFNINYYSQIIKNQKNVSQQTLLSDIKKNPEQFLNAMFDFVNHRLQLIDLKGLSDFLKSVQRVSGKNDYSKLLESLFHVFPIIYRSIEDNQMDLSEFYFKMIAQCLDNMSTEGVYTDLSSGLMKLMFFIMMRFGNREQEFIEKNAGAYIQAVYKAFQVQAYLKQIYVNQKGKIGGTVEEFKQITSKEGIEQIMNQSSIREDFEQSQLTFLRKIAAFYIMMTQNSYQSKQHHKRSEFFINQMHLINDDSQEFKILTQFLQLKTALDLNVDDEVKDQEISEKEREMLTIIQSNKAIIEQIQYFQIKEIEKLTSSVQISQDQSVQFRIPSHLLLLTPYFTFHLVDLEQDFQSFVQNNYKKHCDNCHQTSNQNAICLLCGSIQCFLSKNCLNLPNMKANEGGLSFHSRFHEGGTSMFICTENAKIVLMEHGRSSYKPSPYINKYGEQFNQRSKKWENFFMDEESGGKHVYDEYRKMYMNFSIGNEVIQQRTSTNTIFRVGSL